MSKFKKAVLIFLALLLCFSTSISAEGNEGIHWFLKRNGKRQPSLPTELRFAEELNAYYMDTSLSDESATKRIYLTFDAGYENGNVERILDVLKSEGVPAAFFVLDHVILKNTDLVKRMASEGHLVCNHTKNHKDLTKHDKSYMVENLTDLERIYEEKTGQKMAKYFRFPEGRFSAETLKTANELGYKTVFWSLAYADWDNGRQPDPKAAVKLLLENTHNGAVVLLHPTSKTNADIMGELISSWRAMGYSFGTLDELCAAVESKK